MCLVEGTLDDAHFQLVGANENRLAEDRPQVPLTGQQIPARTRGTKQVVSMRLNVQKVRTE